MVHKVKILKAGALYFTLVFAAGFLLGPIRIAWLVPHFGARAAELMEMPVMLAVIVLAAHWVIGRLAVPPAAAGRLAMGVLALFLMLAAEFTLVLWLQGLSIGEYLTSRDPVAGAAYYLSLGVFALLPLLIRRG